MDFITFYLIQFDLQILYIIGTNCIHVCAIVSSSNTLNIIILKFESNESLNLKIKMI